ncbi:MAG: Gfo/Idh/MocA family oxidoreductase [Polyangiales bacterium]
MRFGIVGTGDMAGTMVKALGSTPGAVVAAVASRSEARAESFARSHRVEHHFGDVRSLAACADVDVVYVASHPARHVEDSLAALEVGKPVLCEKPLATSVSDAVLLADAASKRGVFLMEGMWLRFLPAVRHAEQLVRDRVAGTPLLLQADFGYPVAAGMTTEGTDVGVLLDRAVYPISLAIFVLGKVLDSAALISHDRRGVATQASFLLRHDGGAVSQLAVSSVAFLSNRAVISCERGRIELAEPLLGTERVVLQQHAPVIASPGSSSTPSAKKRIVEALKSSSTLRRVRASHLRAGSSDHFSYGPSPYCPQLREVMDCIERGDAQCATMPLDQSIETLRVIEQSQRGQSA